MGLPQHSPGWGLLLGSKWEDFLGKRFSGERVVPRLAPLGTGAPQELRTPPDIPGTRGTRLPRGKLPVLLSQLC